MTLKTQIASIIVSTLFGILFSICININYKLIYENNELLKIFFTGIFLLSFSLLYFIILLKINNGIIHIYELLSIIIGFIIENVVNKHIKKIFYKKLKK